MAGLALGLLTFKVSYYLTGVNNKVDWVLLTFARLLFFFFEAPIGDNDLWMARFFWSLDWIYSGDVLFDAWTLALFYTNSMLFLTSSVCLKSSISSLSKFGSRYIIFSSRVYSSSAFISYRIRSTIKNDDNNKKYLEICDLDSHMVAAWRLTMIDSS